MAYPDLRRSATSGDALTQVRDLGQHRVLARETAQLAQIVGRPPPRKTCGRRHEPPRYGPGADDEDGYFGESIAATYDESSADMFDPAVVEPASTFWRNWPAPGGWSWPSATTPPRRR